MLVVSISCSLVSLSGFFLRGCALALLEDDEGRRKTELDMIKCKLNLDKLLKCFHINNVDQCTLVGGQCTSVGQQYMNFISFSLTYGTFTYILYTII